MYFQRDTKVYLVWEGQALQLDALASFSSSQTFTERTYSQNGLGNPSMVDYGFAKEKSKPTFSLETYAVLPLLELFNFELVNGTYILQDTNSLVSLDLYFEVTPNYYYAIKNAFTTQLSFSVGKGTILKFQIEGEGSYLLEEEKPSVTYSTFDDYITGDLSNTLLTENNYLMAASCNIVRDLKWLNTKTMLDGVDYVPTKAVMSKLTVGGNLSTYVSSSSFEEITSFNSELDINIGNGQFEFHIGTSIITERLDFSSSLITKFYDFRLLPYGVTATTIQ
jgi:hypothetical protein